jgi:putative membrane protein insertion efficiency factor
LSRPLVFALRALLRAYQLAISPLVGPACRFTPSCSEYAREALDRHGLGRGTLLAARRLSRCHPLGGAGFDPVPEPLPATRLERDG